MITIFLFAREAADRKYLYRLYGDLIMSISEEEIDLGFSVDGLLFANCVYFERLFDNIAKL